MMQTDTQPGKREQKAAQRVAHAATATKMLAAGHTVKEVADELKCSAGRVYALVPGGARVASGKPAYKQRDPEAPKPEKAPAKPKAAKKPAAKKAAKKPAAKKAAKKSKA